MKKIAVAGATGNLGNRIVKALRQQGAEVLALVRKNGDDTKRKDIEQSGAKAHPVNLTNVDEVAQALMGVDCLISAVQGLRDVIVEGQTVLLNAALQAKVPRFIPSDFSTDFRKLRPGENRNFDLRRDFHQVLDKAPIAFTSIFNGAFTDILTSNIPFFDTKKKIVGYWDDPSWLVDFTTMDDTAAYTASAALDSTTPQALCIASFQVSARNLAEFTKNVLGTPFELVKLGSRKDLAEKNQRDRVQHPEGEKEVYPSWQGGQYLQSMFEGHHESLDNSRYPQIRWTTLEQVLRASQRLE